MSRLLPWAITLALVAAAWLVALVTPPDRMALEPFPIAAQVGKEVIGRDFALTVQGIRAADAVTTADGWQARGTWILVDLSAEATHSQARSRLLGATLQIGERTFRASERMPSMFQQQLVPGIPHQGTLAFELPPDALDGAGILRLSTRTDDRGDNVAELPLDLAALGVTSDQTIDTTEWGAQ